MGELAVAGGLSLVILAVTCTLVVAHTVYAASAMVLVFTCVCGVGAPYFAKTVGFLLMVAPFTGRFLMYLLVKADKITRDMVSS